MVYLTRQIVLLLAHWIPTAISEAHPKLLERPVRYTRRVMVDSQLWTFVLAISNIKENYCLWWALTVSSFWGSPKALHVCNI